MEDEAKWGKWRCEYISPSMAETFEPLLYCNRLNDAVKQRVIWVIMGMSDETKECTFTSGGPS